MGSIALVALGFAISRKAVVFLNLFLAGVSILQYFLLGAYAAASFSLFVMLYGILYIFEKKLRFLKSTGYLIFCYLVPVFLYITLNGVTVGIEIIALVGNLLGLLSMSIKEGSPLFRKWVMCAQTITWISFQVIVGAYGMLVGNSVNLIAIVISLVILYKARAAGVNLKEVPEIPELVKKAILKNKADTSKSELVSSAG